MRNDKQKKLRSLSKETADDRIRWDVDLDWKEPIIEGTRRVSGKVVRIDPKDVSEKAASNRIRLDVDLEWKEFSNKGPGWVSGRIARIEPPSGAEKKNEDSKDSVSTHKEAADDQTRWYINLDWRESSSKGTREVSGQVTRIAPRSASASMDAKDNRTKWDIKLDWEGSLEKGPCRVSGKAVRIEPWSASASNKAKDDPIRWYIDLEWEERSSEGTRRVSGGIVRIDPPSESAPEETADNRKRWDIDLEWEERPKKGSRRVRGKVIRTDLLSRSASEETADNQTEWDVDLDWEGSLKKGPRRVSGKVFCTDPTPEPEDTDAGRKVLFQDAEKWLKEQFGAFLGDDAILAKAAALLSTAFIVYFNFLKHRYDVGYYHQHFGVPEKYLGAAWNSAMSDFVLYALIAIVQSWIVLAILLLLLVLFFLARELFVRQFERLSQNSKFSIIKPYTRKAAGIVSLILILLVCYIFCPSLEIVKMLLLGTVAIAGGILFLLIVFLILNAYRISKITNEEERGRLIGFNWFLIVGTVLMVIVCGCLADSVGENIASMETSLTLLSPEEPIHEQLNKLDCEQRKDYWAVIYQPGDQYIIMPCTIDESGEKAAIHVRYHSIIPKEGVVVGEYAFDEIRIWDDTPSNEDDLPMKEKIDRSIDACIAKIFRKLAGFLSAPADTDDPTNTGATVPTDIGTTEPTEPDETVPTKPDETVPPESDETEPTESDETVPTESDETEPTEPCVTELNVYYTWNCDCCCVPGLG